MNRNPLTKVQITRLEKRFKKIHSRLPKKLKQQLLAETFVSFCPLHDYEQLERRSLHQDPVTGSYFCFDCHAHGDMVSLMIGMSGGEAYKVWGKFYNL